MADLMLLLKQDLRGDAPGLAGDSLHPWPPVCNSDKTSVCVLHTQPEYARLIEAATRRFVVVTQKPERNTVPKLETSNTRRRNGKRRHSPGPSPGAPANARRGKLETVADFILSAPRSLWMVTAATKLRHLLLGRKPVTNLHSMLKSRDITLPTKVHIVKAMVFPVVMCGCESWAIKKAECQRIDAFELCC